MPSQCDNHRSNRGTPPNEIFAPQAPHLAKANFNGSSFREPSVVPDYPEHGNQYGLIGKLGRNVPPQGEEERKLTLEMARSRQAFIEELYRCPYIAKRIVRLLRKVHARNISLFRTIELSQCRNKIRSAAAGDKFIKRLPRVIAEAERILDNVALQEELPRALQDNLIRTLSKAPLNLKILLQLWRSFEVKLEKASRRENGSHTELKLEMSFEEALACYRALKQRQESWLNARESLIMSHARLVISIAKKNVKPDRHSLLELINVGFLGSMRAADKFDPSLNFKFTTYASWWIADAIRTHIREKDRLFPLSETVAKKLSKLRELTAQPPLGGDPYSEAELMDCLGVSYAELLQLKALAAEIQFLHSERKDSKRKFELLQDTDDRQVDDSLAKLDLALSQLSPAEAVLIKAIFGINHEPSSVRAVAPFIGKSQQRANKMKVKALGKLRASMQREQD